MQETNPWAIDEHNNACFVVKDRGGQVVAYVYFEDEPGRRSAANPLTLWMGEFVKRFRGIFVLSPRRAQE